MYKQRFVSCAVVDRWAVLVDPSEDSWTISLSESVAGVVPGQNQRTELFNFEVYIL